MRRNQFLAAVGLTLLVAWGDDAGAQGRDGAMDDRQALKGQTATIVIPDENYAPELAGIGALMRGNAVVVILAERDKAESYFVDPAQGVVRLAARERDMEFVLKGQITEQELVASMRNSSAMFGLLEDGAQVRVDEFAYNGTFASIVTDMSTGWSGKAMGVDPPRLAVDSCFLHFDKPEAQLVYLRLTLPDPTRRCRR